MTFSIRTQQGPLQPPCQSQQSMTTDLCLVSLILGAKNSKNILLFPAKIQFLDLEVQCLNVHCTFKQFWLFVSIEYWSTSDLPIKPKPGHSCMAWAPQSNWKTGKGLPRQWCNKRFGWYTKQISFKILRKYYIFLNPDQTGLRAHTGGLGVAQPRRRSNRRESENTRLRFAGLLHLWSIRRTATARLWSAADYLPICRIRMQTDKRTIKQCTN